MISDAIFFCFCSCEARLRLREVCVRFGQTMSGFHGFSLHLCLCVRTAGNDAVL